VLRECKPSPSSKSQTKLIPDSNLDFRINPDFDPDVCQIAPKILWIHYISASVISPSIVKIGCWLYEKC